MAASPSHLIVGGGIHGLSVAWHLAERLGPDGDVVVLEKERVGAGASGLAGGIVRNYYRSAAITGVIRDSIEMFEAEPEAYGFRQVGYVAAVPELQVPDLVAIRAQHAEAGYQSELLTGAESCREYLTWLFPDWEAEAAGVLSEPRGGWADAMQTVRHLAARARAAGASIREGVEVTGFELSEDRVERVLTTAGPIRCENLIIAPGPWAARLWEMLGLPPELEVASNGSSERRPLSAYWKAQEGEFQLPGVGLGDRAGREPPVVHLDQPGPLLSDRDGTGDHRRRLGDLFPLRADRDRRHRGRAAGRRPGPGARSLRIRQPRPCRRAGLHRVLRLRPGHGLPPLPRPRRGLEGHPRAAGSSTTPPTTTRSATGCWTTPTR